MELFGLKHKWLFHGWVEVLCPCLSRLQEGRGGLKLSFNFDFSATHFPSLWKMSISKLEKVLKVEFLGLVRKFQTCTQEMKVLLGLHCTIFISHM